MELLQLRYFYESSKNESFTKTAEMHRVPTTSVSASIKRLEKELGCQLFERTANKIKLNENGIALQQSLCTIFHKLDEITQKLSTHEDDTREIKLLVRGMRRKITDIITEFSSLHTHISFKTVFDNHDADFEQFDIIIDEHNNRYTEYERIELFTVRLKLKCTETDKLASQNLTLSQLCDRPFVLMDQNGNMSKVLKKACSRAGFTPRIAFLCNDIECYEKLISSGMGIGIGREKNTSSNDSSIVDLNVTDFEEQYTVYAYYSKKEYYGNIKSFIEFLKTMEI